MMLRLAPALRDLENAVLDAARAEDLPSGPLRINASRVAAIHHLAPVLGGFLEAFLDFLARRDPRG